VHRVGLRLEMDDKKERVRVCVCRRMLGSCVFGAVQNADLYVSVYMIA